MIFWFFVIALTASAVAAILLPLAGRALQESAGARHDREVYLDQLSELEREQGEGRIGPEEAGAARAEIARRLLSADAEADVTGTSRDGRLRRRFAGLVALAVVPLATLLTYSLSGSPHLPPQPLSARTTAPAADQDIRLLIARAEKHLAENPDDGQGWEVLGPIYMRMERIPEAMMAFRAAIRLLGPTAAREANLGEAVLASEGGVVTREARQAFERALQLDAMNFKARFYLAVALEQDGDAAAAADGFRRLLDDSPDDAPWRAFVERALVRVERKPLPPGPTREQVAAAGEMSTGERTEMIEGMVAGLAARLEQQPADPEGWIRLVRAYLVLERRGDAVKAAGKALKLLQDPASRKNVKERFETMGLTPEETGIQ